MIQKMLEELDQKGREAGPTMNKGKTKILSQNNEEDGITVKGEKIELVTEAIYLGQLITWENRTEKEVERRITLAWKKFWALKNINSTVKTRLKFLICASHVH